MSAPKTWMTLEILECSIERIKHALIGEGFYEDFIKVTKASVQVPHVGCLQEHNDSEAI